MPLTRRALMTLTLAGATAATLAACSGGNDTASDSTPATTQTPGTVTIESNTGSVEVTVPVQRAACLDNRSFEILATWGIPLVAAPKPLIPATVTAYDGEDVVDVGMHRDPDLDALAATEPDLVISGQRFTQHNEAITAGLDTSSKPGVLIDIEPREGEPLDAELVRHATALGQVFGKEAEAETLASDLAAAVERAKAAYDGSSTVMAVNVSGGEIGYVAPGVGRTFGPIFDLLGLVPALEVEGASSDHEGDDISVEAIAESNPDWLLVLDRDGGVSADEEGYTPAQDVIAGNAALANVTAVTAAQVVYAPQDTYANENIITYTEILSSIADAFEKQG